MTARVTISALAGALVYVAVGCSAETTVHPLEDADALQGEGAGPLVVDPCEGNDILIAYNMWFRVHLDSELSPSACGVTFTVETATGDLVEVEERQRTDGSCTYLFFSSVGVAYLVTAGVPGYETQETGPHTVAVDVCGKQTAQLSPIVIVLNPSLTSEPADVGPVEQDVPRID